MTSERRPDGKTNTYRAKESALSAGNGSFIWSAQSACCISNRNSLKINDLELGGYKAGDAVIMISSENFSSRKLWTPFNAPNEALNMKIKGVSINDSRFSVLGEIESGKAFITTGTQKSESTKKLYFATGLNSENFSQ